MKGPRLTSDSQLSLPTCYKFLFFPFDDNTPLFLFTAKAYLISSAAPASLPPSPLPLSLSPSLPLPSLCLSPSLPLPLPLPLSLLPPCLPPSSALLLGLHAVVRTAVTWHFQPITLLKCQINCDSKYLPIKAHSRLQWF